MSVSSEGKETTAIYCILTVILAPKLDKKLLQRVTLKKIIIKVKFPSCKFPSIGCKKTDIKNNQIVNIFLPEEGKTISLFPSHLFIYCLVHLLLAIQHPKLTCCENKQKN